jgi:serine/threonine protein kinase/WD40 repeat protein
VLVKFEAARFREPALGSRSVNDCSFDRDPFELVAEEFLARFRAGERPSIDDFATRHPGLATQIHELLPALVMVEQDLTIEPESQACSARPRGIPVGSRQLGDYRLLREIGRGGMGVVYEAEQVSLGRRVALKVLPARVTMERKALERFRREAKAAARLHHTNIVPVFDVGENDDVAYYAMQYIQGQGLDQVIQELRRLDGTKEPFFPGLTPARALVSGTWAQPLHADAETVAEPWDACRTQTAIPSGCDESSCAVLPDGTAVSKFGSSSRRQPFFRSVAQIGRQAAQGLAYAHARGIVHRDIKPSNLLLDTAGVVWIADFGLAKADDDGLTATGDVVGTLRYIAPERFRGQSDARGDVYALGLTLYELATLRPAFDCADRLRLVERIKGAEPTRPRALDDHIPRDLETIIQKAINKDPARRYASAEAMAEDLRRYLSDEPIQARAASPAERSARWARHHPTIATVSLLLALVFVVSTIASLIVAGNMSYLAAKEKKAAAAAVAETYRAMLSEVKALRVGRAPGWRERALEDLARLATLPTPRRNLTELRSEAAATLGTPDIRLTAQIQLPSSELASFTFSRDGSTLLTAGRLSGLDFWNVPQNRHAAFVDGLAAGGSALENALFLPDGQGLVVGTAAHGVVFTDAQGVRTNRATITQGTSQPAKLALSANGQRIAIEWASGAGITVHDLASGAPLKRFQSSLFALSPDGRWLALASGSEIVLAPIDSNDPPTVLAHKSGARALAFSPDGVMLAGAFQDHNTVLWDVAKREQFGTLRGHRERVLDVAFSPDGEWIATASLDYTARIWEWRTGQNIATLPSANAVVRVRWSPTGETLATSTDSARDVFLYTVTGRHRVQQWLTGHQVELGSLAAHPRLERLATSGYTELSSWDLSARRPTAVAMEPHPGSVTALAYSPDGSLLATGSWLGTTYREILIRDANTGAIERRISRPEVFYALAFDASGKRLACGDMAGNVAVWELPTCRPVRQFSTGSSVNSVIFLDQAECLVTHGKDAVLLFDLKSGQLKRKVELTGGGIRSLVADRAQSRLVVGLQSGAITSLTLPGLTVARSLAHAHEDSIECLALSPEGRLLVTAGADHRAVLRDAYSLEALLSFPEWTGNFRDLTFDMSGHRLAIVGTNCDVDLWNVSELYKGLATLGLAWDRPTPIAALASGFSPEIERARSAVPVIRRPGTPNPVDLESARLQTQAGVSAFQSGNWTESIAILQRARDLMITLHKAAPRDDVVASQLSICLTFLGNALLNEKRMDDAAASFEDARQLLESMRQRSAVDLYNLTCVSARLSSLPDATCGPQTARERARLADRAIEVLQQSVAAGMNDFNHIDRDPDLESIRNRPEFRALILDGKFPRNPFANR